eukprot:5741185-Pleurochrysis_carterae.AAC.1
MLQLIARTCEDRLLGTMCHRNVTCKRVGAFGPHVLHCTTRKCAVADLAQEVGLLAGCFQMSVVVAVYEHSNQDMRVCKSRCGQNAPERGEVRRSGGCIWGTIEQGANCYPSI